MTDGKILLMGDQASPVNLHQLWPTIPCEVLSQPLNCSLASLKMLYPFCSVLYFSESSDNVIQSIRRIRNLYPDVPQIWVSPQISPEASVAAFRAGVHDILFEKEASEVEHYLEQLLNDGAEVQTGRGVGQSNSLYLETKCLLTADHTVQHHFLDNDQSKDLLRMRCFGTFGLSYQGRVLLTNLNQREKSLLAYLILRSHRPIHKDRLAEVFWPESTPSSAKNLLHVTISRIRKWAVQQKLPAELIVFENNCYTISHTIKVESDYGLFKQYFHQVQRNTAPKPDSVLPHLLDAYRLYSDVLLEDIYSEAWVLEVQEQAAETFAAILHHIGETLHFLGWYDLAICSDERLLLHDPLAEQAYHRLMHAYGQLGWRNKVVQCFQKYKKTIEEIQLKPAPEIIASMALLTGVECL